MSAGDIPNFETISLGVGGRPDWSGELCVMELAAWVAGEPHTDNPACVSPVIAEFLRRWNDDLDGIARQQLKPYAMKGIGTNGTPEQEEQRAWLMTDWLIRAYTPAWLDAAGQAEHAEALRGLPDIASALDAITAQQTIDKGGGTADRPAIYSSQKVSKSPRAPHGKDR